ncbi:sialidase family protein [Chelatococcus asaccharovorans]|uniref:sialidase family protein n=1 Tax=Chelatococcus asaccharovorans TaxID=28210 RepID=UPI00224C79A3|nr:sialidase family protein [Chelatococcus asaccharovorans]CAH1651628.1 BNR repeat protein [Chelatococcus asaccharovorans]CAH1693032.1 BNR repeat protein [Chelatococcus asaccharovorans]
MMANRFQRPRPVQDARHGIVYRNDSEFAAWAFLGGLWLGADGDVVAAFTRNDCVYTSPDDVHHDMLSVSRGRVSTIRSSDGGETWDEASLRTVFDMSTSAEDIAANGPPDYGQEEPVDFLDKNVFILSGAVPAHFVPTARPWISLSSDGGRSWRRPVVLPLGGLHSLSGQGSTSVRADGVSLIALTSVTPDGWTRRPLVYASANGGQSWQFLSFITPEQDDGTAVSAKQGSPRFGAHRYFYPRPLPLRNGRILCSMRSQRDPTSVLWTEMFESEDGGRTWHFLSRVNDWGAPGDIVEMADGRIVCVYGYRLAPYGIRARVSEDGGTSWGSELILRDDGGSWDLGYPRVIEVKPGLLLTTYYMNTRDDPIQLNGGVRHIARTLFRPD